VEKSKRGLRLALLILVFSAGAAAGAYVVLAIVTADISNWSLWARDFAKSPGAAGTAAVIAAVIASLSIGRQVTVQRITANTTTWWKTFEWASGRALPSVETDNALPDSVTISTLQGLKQTATDDVQRVACGGMIDVLTPRVVSMSDDAREPSKTSEPRTSAAFDALTSYVQASYGTPAASPAAEAAVYERKVTSALTDLAPAIQAFREPPGTDSGVDAIAEVDGVQVAVEVTYSRTPQVVRARTRSAAQKHRGNTYNPLVVVSRFPSPFTLDEEAEMRAVVVQWNNSDDNSRLLAALRRASEL